MRANDREAGCTIPQGFEQRESQDSLTENREEGRIERILLFGGTFDPPHIGHLMMAQLALEQCAVDTVWFLPAPSPPHKTEVDSGTIAWRTKMVETLIDGFAGMHVVSIEEQLPKPSYTIDTVRACQAMYPGVKFSFLLGSDSLADLPTWREADELTERVTFVVAGRTGFQFETMLAQVRADLPKLAAFALEMPRLDVSSTWIRNRLQNDLSLCGLVPDRVLEIWRQGR